MFFVKSRSMCLSVASSTARQRFQRHLYSIQVEIYAGWRRVRRTLHVVPHKSRVSRLIQLGLRDMKLRRHWELADGLSAICHRLRLCPVPFVARTRDFDYDWYASLGWPGVIKCIREELTKLQRCRLWSIKLHAAHTKRICVREYNSYDISWSFFMTNRIANGDIFAI